MARDKEERTIPRMGWVMFSLSIDISIYIPQLASPLKVQIQFISMSSCNVDNP